MLLALDTSTAWASLALYDGARLHAELSWHAQRRHGDEVFPMLERALAVAAEPISRIDRIAVALGPGSFTGVRVAIAAAMGLARGLGAAVVGVGTLDVAAHPHRASGASVCALLPAGRTDFYAGFYVPGERSGATRTGAPAAEMILAGIDEIADRAEGHTLFVGEIDAATEGRLSELLGGRASVASPVSRVRRAGYLAELGWQELEAGRATRVDELEPMYVKPASVRRAGD
jgi:tRNA threonylcarbamoyladenosine biosynthesis protein TsaB